MSKLKAAMVVGSNRRKSIDRKPADATAMLAGAFVDRPTTLLAPLDGREIVAPAAEPIPAIR